MTSSEPLPAAPSSARSAEVLGAVEHLFRHEAGKMVAILTRIFGVEHLTLAEDVVQDALARALQTWPFYGVPENPSAWIIRAARNRALDVVRRERNFREKEAEIVRVFDTPVATPDAGAGFEQEITDDRLRMMFVCCHPEVPADAQAPLALKTLCGFGVTEISRAFLSTDAAMAKRLTRAKQHIREAGIPFLAYAPFGGPKAEPLATRVPRVAALAMSRGDSVHRAALAAMLDAMPGAWPVIGSTRVESVLDSIGAADLAVDDALRQAFADDLASRGVGL